MNSLPFQQESLFKYTIKAHKTIYKGVIFRSRLEARWAAFFDLAGWQWEYEPIDLDGWTPDFRITFPCGHSECNGSHTLLVEVKPYYSLDEFHGHPCLNFPYGRSYPNEIGDDGVDIPADASAAFGNNPDITRWEMVHGAGGGYENVRNWVFLADVDELWIKAGNIVRYLHQER